MTDLSKQDAERLFDLIAVAVQNTVDEGNRLDGLAAIEAIRAELSTLRGLNRELTDAWNDQVVRLSRVEAELFTLKAERDDWKARYDAEFANWNRVSDELSTLKERERLLRTTLRKAWNEVSDIALANEIDAVLASSPTTADE